MAIGKRARRNLQRRMVEAYDRGMRSANARLLYDGSDFYNFGYWSSETKEQDQASRDLVARLLDLLPAVGTEPILDVACGLGASTRQIVATYPANRVVAINISRAQLSQATGNAPASRVCQMDAARLGFRDATFGSLLCVESAFHFDTREDFLREAFRVLKPGGGLAFSDILARHSRLAMRGAFYIPAVNCLQSPSDLENALAAAGFVDIMVIDATQECWGGFARNLRRLPERARRAGRVSLAGYAAGKAISLLYPALVSRYLRYYLLVSARKPL